MCSSVHGVFDTLVVTKDDKPDLDRKGKDGNYVGKSFPEDISTHAITKSPEVGGRPLTLSDSV